MTAHDDVPTPGDEVVLRALGEAFRESPTEPPADLVDAAHGAFRTRSPHRLAMLVHDSLDDASTTHATHQAGSRVIRFTWDTNDLEVTLDHLVRLRLHPPASLVLFVESTTSRQTVLMPDTGEATAAFDGFPLRITAMVDDPVTTPWITG
jgi:hypothetical protein